MKEATSGVHYDMHMEADEFFNKKVFKPIRGGGGAQGANKLSIGPGLQPNDNGSSGFAGTP